MKILISSYTCSPYRGSEPGIGWKFVYYLTKYAKHELWVLCEEIKWKPDIEKFKRENPDELNNVHFVWIPKIRAKWLRKIWPPSYYWFYHLWQIKAFRAAKRLHQSIHFDLVHQLNMGTFREPGYLWKLDAPFVWGPFGGLGYTRWSILPQMGVYGFFHYLGRNVVNYLHAHLMVRTRLAAKRASDAIIVASPENQDSVRRIWKRDSTVICEVGLVDGAEPLNLGRQGGEPLRLTWSAVHEHRKALNLLLDALSKVPCHVDWTLDVLGDGPCNKAWKQRAEKYGLNHKITWHGLCTKQDAISTVQRSHVFVITSVWDLTSAVLLEALSFGVPVICLDHCGFSAVITDECAIRIQVINPKQIVQDIAVGIERLYRNETLRQELSRGAVKRAGLFTWRKKIEDLQRLYEKAVQGGK